MAQAVMEMRPGTKLGFGLAIQDGFYYDFILSEPFARALSLLQCLWGEQQFDKERAVVRDFFPAKTEVIAAIFRDHIVAIGMMELGF